jgi:hypothetical protein
LFPFGKMQRRPGTENACTNHNHVIIWSDGHRVAILLQSLGLQRLV